MSWIHKLVFVAAGWAVAEGLRFLGEKGELTGIGRGKKPAYPVNFKEFVSEHTDIVEAFRVERGHDPATIPAACCPGFRLAGSFFVYLGGHPGSGYGDVSIVSRNGERIQERNYPQYPYLHLSLFPDQDDGLSTLNWNTVEALLPRLVLESVRAGLSLYEPFTEKRRLVVELVHRLLAENLDPESTDFLKNEICERYNLPLSLKETKVLPPRPDLEEISMSRAVPLNFSTARWEKNQFIVSNYDGQRLVIERVERVLRVPVQGEIVELPLDGLEVTRKDREVDTDTKTHHYCYILLRHGNKSASVYERFKDYYEGGRVQAELDKQQDSSRAILEAVARALRSGDLSQLEK
jgi:hypothetical protein